MKMLRRERERKLENKRRVIKYLLTTVCSIVLVTAIIFASIGVDSLIKNSGITLRNKVGISSDNYEIDNAMVKYFLNATYISFSNYYGSSLSYYLDPDEPLKNQKYDDGESWFDYFLEAAKDSVSEMLTLAEGAKAAGVELSDDELKAISIYMSNQNEENFGRGVNADDVEKCIKLMALAYKYEQIMLGSAEATEEEIETYYEENKKSYLLFSYLAYSFSYEEDGAYTQEEAKEMANKLAANTTVEDYEGWVTAYIEANDDIVDETDPEKALKNALFEDKAYKEDDELCEWAFGDKITVGSTLVYDNESKDKIIVYMITAAPARDETITKNAMHILLSESTFGTLENASLKASEILSDWEINDGTQEGFSLLALAYSEDTGSSMSGGAYYNILSGEMTTEFNDWCFDENRKSGETGIVKTEYGYHIMYFIGDGLETYQAQVSDVLTGDAYDEAYKVLEDTYAITVDKDILARIYE